MSELVRASKLLSLVLRHQPEAIGLVLDEQGWADVNELISKTNATRSAALTIERVVQIVRSSDKQRLALRDDGRRVRANQGHSVEIELGLQHGSAARAALSWDGAQDFACNPRRGAFVDDAAKRSLISRCRHSTLCRHRHGKPVVLDVRSGDMVRNGCRFYQAANGVWLTEHVPVGAIVFPRLIDEAN